MLSEIGDFLHTVLDKSTQPFISLDEEVNHLKNYLQIFNRRMDYTLIFDIDMDASTKKSPIPPLLLQPIIENALKYGVNRTHSKLSLSSYLSNEFLVLKVRTYVSISSNRLSSTGIGLKNTQQRLMLSFGPTAKLITQPLGE